MNIKKDYNLYLERFQDVVKFLVVKEILRKYPSFDAYRIAPNSDKAFNLHSAISPKLLTSLGKFNNKRCALKFIKQSAEVFKYHFHCHKTYKSGKSFARNSWFEMNLDIVKEAFENKKDWNITNKIFSKDAHTWVDKHIFKFEKEKDMTKEEKIQYQKDYEAGLKAFPLETILKSEARNKRANAKRQKTRIKKLTQQAMVEEELEIQRLKKENEQLRAEINYLKSLKDLNSDVPDGNLMSDKIEYTGLDKYFPEGIDDEDPAQKELIGRMSEECRKKLNEEFENEKQTLEEKDENFDYEKELKNLQNALKDFPDDKIEQEKSATIIKTSASKNKIPDDDIPETFDDHREAVAKKIANAIKDGIVGVHTGKHFLKMVGCENYKLQKIPEQIPGSFGTKKQLAFIEWLAKTITPFEKEFDKTEIKWLIKHYNELKILVA